MEAATRLSYSSMKDLQLWDIVGLASGPDVFGVLPILWRPPLDV